MSETGAEHSPVAEAAGEAAAEAADQVIAETVTQQAAAEAVAEAAVAQANAKTAADMATGAAETAVVAHETAHDAAGIAEAAGEVASETAAVTVADHERISGLESSLQRLHDKWDAFETKHYPPEAETPEVTEVTVDANSEPDTGHNPKLESGKPGNSPRSTGRRQRRR